MSSDVTIRADGIGKRYRIGGRVKYKALRDSLTEMMTLPYRGLKRLARGAGEEAARGRRETFWALKDVSFEIRQGDAVGLIGRNGAGKSTLLKILSRITEPTEGRAVLHGRVGSLLEIGTGFHPELTGRENIFLSGAIMGMTRAEILRKFDQMVAFAEIERFIDTPTKHYSSGMYVRLAFAVAAHLEPEILLVDEVLAVGDATFQKKCLGKMQNVAGEGRTVVFVSHAMPAIQHLCTRGIVLHQGRVDYQGDVSEAIQRYMAVSNVETGIIDLSEVTDRFGSGEMRLLRFWIEDADGNPVPEVPCGSDCALAVLYETPDGRERRDVSMSFHVNTLMGMPISLVNTDMMAQHFERAPARGVIRLRIPQLPLSTGRYTLDLNLATHAGHTYADFVRNAVAFDVGEGDFYGTGRRNRYNAPLLLPGSWEVTDDSEIPRGVLA